MFLRRAVRHRVRYLADKIEAAVTRADQHRPSRILSVAAGPAMEIQHLGQVMVPVTAHEGTTARTLAGLAGDDYGQSDDRHAPGWR